MRCRLFKIFLPILLFSVVSAQKPFQLTYQDVRMTMQGMLGYHVEYKEFSPLLARRTLKIYVEQFDPEKIYLLAGEVRPFVDPKEGRLQAVVQNYLKDDFTEFGQIDQVFQRSVIRARTLRSEIEAELIASDSIPGGSRAEYYSDYAADEAALRSRLKTQLTRILQAEQQAAPRAAWTAERRQKIFALWERRFARFETPYLSQDAEHMRSMHVLKAMAKSLDAHTSYFSPEEAFDMRTSLEKQFEGIGVVLRESVDGVVIYDLVKGGPAERSGKISQGDVLVEIDGLKLNDLAYEEVLKKLQGEGRSKVQLGLQSGTEFYRVELTREKIVMTDERVQYSFEPFADGIIGRINLPSFYESEGFSCELDMREALKALKKEGKILGLVLDMRENSGGFLNQAVKVAGLFVTSGVIVISKYAQGEVQYLRDLDVRSYYSGPLVILTSKASASAAEIVAQALQDYGTALVVGDERTYGKGTIQYQTVTDSGASSFFKVTVGRYYTVSGRSTQIEGVKADLLVPTPYSIYNIGERYLEYPLKNDQIPSAYVDPLTDIDPRNQRWFEKNYLPNIQKKLSVWTQMLPVLKNNSSYRLKSDKDFAFFQKTLDRQRKGAGVQLSPTENWGVRDLQMIEAVNILKDMAIDRKG
ncbi:MAG: PDZ domain-containing protein [Verrucomicrobia bacterium]|nr:PDZ domain-containing protein [Verrucomicrobiota bacterium]